MLDCSLRVRPVTGTVSRAALQHDGDREIRVRVPALLRLTGQRRQRSRPAYESELKTLSISTVAVLSLCCHSVARLPRPWQQLLIGLRRAAHCTGGPSQLQPRCPGPGRAQAPGRSVVQPLPCSSPLEKSYDFGTLSVGPGLSWTSPCGERGCAHPSARWALTKSRSAIAAASTRVGIDGGAPARAGLGPVGSGLRSTRSGCAAPSSARVADRRPKSRIVAAAPTWVGPGSKAGSALRERQRAFTRVVWQ